MRLSVTTSTLQYRERKEAWYRRFETIDASTGSAYSCIVAGLLPDLKYFAADMRRQQTGPSDCWESTEVCENTGWG